MHLKTLMKPATVRERPNPELYHAGVTVTGLLWPLTDQNTSNLIPLRTTCLLSAHKLTNKENPTQSDFSDANWQMFLVI